LLSFLTQIETSFGAIRSKIEERRRDAASAQVDRLSVVAYTDRFDLVR